MHGPGAVRGGAVVLDASGSSQLVSGLLLAAPRFDEGVEVRHGGPPVPSAPHIAMTVRMLRDAGADVAELRSGTGPAARRAGRAAARHLAGAAGRLSLGTSPWSPTCPTRAVPGRGAGHRRHRDHPDWPRDSLQAAGAILDVLTRMGARCEVGADGLTVTGTGRIHGITADLRDVSELAPVLTAVAALAESPSVFTGMGHTRTQETDRLAALAKEINALGGDVTELPDGLQIRPRPLRAGQPADRSPATTTTGW